MTATSNSVIGFDVFLKLTESEARALEAIAGYSPEEFLEFFYKNLGKSYLEPHEAGLISLFSSVRSVIPAHLKRIDKTRKVFQDENPNKITL